MDYWRLRSSIEKGDLSRVVGSLEALREQLDRDVPAKSADADLLLATWNVRDFGKPENKRRGWGPRFPESHFYIAEVISRFDFVAVQEVNELEEWQRVVEILGPDWDWIATDVTDEDLGGNGERLTYVWDRRKVRFENVAGELVLPTKLLISKHLSPKVDADGDNVHDDPDPSDPTLIDGKPIGQQFRRTPFAALFRAGWFKFEICTVHLYYGAESGGKLEERIEEIERIGSYFGERADHDLGEGRSLILLGDFNIASRKHKTMDGLLDAGFTVPKLLAEVPPTNAKQTKFYDQIVFRTHEGALGYLDVEAAKGADARAGRVDLFERLYRPEQRDEYAEQIAACSNSTGKTAQEDPEGFFLDWRTYQFSDHFPLWVRLEVNGSAEYLRGLS